MAKYIKLDYAELALKAVCNTCDADDCRGCYINTNGVEELVSNTIGTVPTIEIVRCRDCIFRKHPDSFESHEGLCPFLNTDEWDEDFYCGYGERKNNGRTETENV